MPESIKLSTSGQGDETLAKALTGSTHSLKPSSSVSTMTGDIPDSFLDMSFASNDDADSCRPDSVILHHIALSPSIRIRLRRITPVHPGVRIRIPPFLHDKPGARYVCVSKPSQLLRSGLVIESKLLSKFRYREIQEWEVTRAFGIFEDQMWIEIQPRNIIGQLYEGRAHYIAINPNYVDMVVTRCLAGYKQDIPRQSVWKRVCRFFCVKN